MGGGNSGERSGGDTFFWGGGGGGGGGGRGGTSCFWGGGGGGGRETGHRVTQPSADSMAVPLQADLARTEESLAEAKAALLEAKRFAARLSQRWDGS